MLMLTLLLLLGHSWGHELNLYIVRHGARSPTQTDMSSIFGVAQAQLTPQGRSQSYYFGKELRSRHRSVPDDLMMVYASPDNRTVETARYLLQGWYKLQNSTDGVYFKTDPKYLPPVSLSYKPVTESAWIDQRSHEDKLVVVNKSLVGGAKCLGKGSYPPESLLEHELWRRMSVSEVCNKFDSVHKGICSGDKSYKRLTKEFLNMQDIRVCMEFAGHKIPQLNHTDVSLLERVKLNYNQRKLGDQPRVAASITQLLTFIEDAIQAAELSVIVLVTHDTQQLPLLKALLGEEEFADEVPDKRVPFLNVIRLKVRGEQLRVFMNDREMPLSDCPRVANKCQVMGLLDRLDEYRRPLEEICPKSPSKP